MAVNIFNKRDPRIDFKNEKEINLTWKDYFGGFLKSKIFKFLLFLIIPIVILNFWLFRFDDYGKGCHINIKPSILEGGNLKIKRALNVIKDKSPNYYDKVCTYVKTIATDLPCGGMGGGCFHQLAPKMIEVSTLGISGKDSNLTASIIIHETCHSIQNEEKRPFDEGECYGEMNKFLDQIGVKSPWKN